jgi:hypothetical protein
MASVLRTAGSVVFMIDLILLNLIPAILVIGGLTAACLLPFRLGRRPANIKRRQAPQRRPARARWALSDID